jgi:hypothetical protein
MKLKGSNKGHIFVMESFQPMVRPTLSRKEQIMLTLTQKPLIEKTTCQSMARAVQSSPDRSTVGSIKYSSDRSLHITEASSNIIAYLPFKKSKERVEPVRCADAYAQYLSCQVNNAETPNLVWVLLRLFSRNIISS